MTLGRYPRLRMGMAAAAILTAVGLLWRGVVRVEVQGASMVPTLRQGDRMVALAGLPGRPGDIVAVRDPRSTSQVLVKRVAAVGADRTLDLRGDQPSASTDSRTFGPVSPDLVVGRVVWRYWPPARRGPVELSQPHKRSPQAFR